MKAFLVLASLVYVATAYRHAYLNKQSEEIDSDEHGVAPGKSSTTCKCGWANRVTSRIVGGEETEVNQFPFAIGLLHRKNAKVSPFIFCGGTIITEYHALTAAHCTVDESASNLAIIVGEHSVLSWKETDATEVINVKSITNHENYESDDDTNDIALLTLETKITFNSRVGPACLPTQRHQFDLVDKYIKVMGWGDTQTNGPQSKWLRHTNLRVIPLDICKKSYRAFISTTAPKQICTFSKGRDACQGDSGGPIVYLDPSTNRYTLVGVVSYGADCASEVPGVNTEVAAYLDWISKNIAATNKKGVMCTKK